MGLAQPSFLSKTDPATLIVYGLVSEPGRIVSALIAADTAPPALTNQYALIGPSTEALRLSSPGWMEVSLDERLSLTDSQELYRLCREKVLHGTSHFSLLIRQFLNGYLDFVVSQAEANRAELEGDPPAADIFSHRDWVFSAWLPLPQARLLLPPEFNDDAPQFADIDIAFCRAGRVTAVMIDGTSTPTKSQQAKRDYLRAHHPQLDFVHIHKDRLRDGIFPADDFPGAFARYWDGLTLPHGPNPPDLS